jgi:hypothetical protein
VSRLGDRDRRSFLYEFCSFLYVLCPYGFWSFLYVLCPYDILAERLEDVLGYGTEIDALRPRLRRSRFQAPSRKTGACLTS